MPTTPGPDGNPIRAFRDRAAWWAWLERHHAAAPGIWVRLAKKSSGLASVTYDEALDVALCFGWIDGQRRSLDASHSLQKFTPRARRSMWSKRNREKALALIAAGTMRPAGRAEVDRARQDGRWEAAYDGPRTIAVPPDLEEALTANRRARAFFATLDSRNRFAILFRLQAAKKPETRAKRLRLFVEMLAREEKLHP